MYDRQKNMKAAIIGYGKMGHEIEQVLLQRNHQVALTIDSHNRSELSPKRLEQIDIAFEFTTPDQAAGNIMQCLECGVPVVCGTTGTKFDLETIANLCRKNKTAFIHATNFSIGVNIMFSLNDYLARLMNRFGLYDITIEETHHRHKIDAPSGTAITLAEGIIENVDRKDRWTLETAEKTTDIPIHAIRKGEVPGIHEITYESDVDTISIKHDAKSRAGFALGAVIAAEFTAGKKGFLGMDDMLKF